MSALESSEPLSLMQWIRWILCFQGLTTFATGKPRSVSWVTLETGDLRDPTVATVFGPGIDQEPHSATDLLDKAVVPDGRPLFTLQGLRPQHRLPVLLNRWGELQDGPNPFLALYRFVLDHPDLPVRAQFLQIVQALEALDAFDRRLVEGREVDEFKRRRQELVEELSIHSDPQTVRLVKEMLRPYPPQALAGRLARLIGDLPQSVQADLDHPEMKPLRSRLRASRPNLPRRIHEELAALRNALSHGESFSDHELSPWVRPLSLVAKGTLMMLLGFHEAEIERGLVGRSS